MVTQEGQIAARMVAEQPTPTAAADTITDASSLRDRWGRSFNPELHKVDSAGQPVTVQRDGKVVLQCKRKGRESGGTPSSHETQPSLPGIDGQPPGPSPDSIATGTVMAESIFLIASALGGEEFKPTAPEKQSVTAAWIGYAEARQLPSLPPEFMLAGVMLAYLGPRFQKPTVRGRLKQWWDRRRNPQGGTDASRPDSGNNGSGQDDAGNANLA